jgi:formyl-CoA transferase
VWQAAKYLGTGEPPGPMGSAHPLSAPYQAFRTADGHVIVGAGSQALFRRLCGALGVDALVDDPRFKNPKDRSDNRAALTTELEKALVRRTSREWIDVLNAAGVPSGPIYDVKEVFEDEHVRSLGLATPVQHPKLGEIRVQSPAVTLSRTPGQIRTAAAEAGEHTDDILRELGYSPEQIVQLRRDGAV